MKSPLMEFVTLITLITASNNIKTTEIMFEPSLITVGTETCIGIYTGLSQDYKILDGYHESAWKAPKHLVWDWL